VLFLRASESLLSGYISAAREPSKSKKRPEGTNDTTKEAREEGDGVPQFAGGWVLIDSFAEVERTRTLFVVADIS